MWKSWVQIQWQSRGHAWFYKTLFLLAIPHLEWPLGSLQVFKQWWMNSMGEKCVSDPSCIPVEDEQRELPSRPLGHHLSDMPLPKLFGKLSVWPNFPQGNASGQKRSSYPTLNLANPPSKWVQWTTLQHGPDSWDGWQWFELLAQAYRWKKQFPRPYPECQERIIPRIWDPE